jgi:hypothetical protein
VSVKALILFSDLFEISRFTPYINGYTSEPSVPGPSVSGQEKNHEIVGFK